MSKNLKANETELITSQTEDKRKNWLDILKAFAIIAVVFYHLDIFKYGYLGVDLFLVINGFLITSSIMKKYKKGEFSYFKFLIDRIIRLWPMVLMAAAVSLVTGYFLMLPDELENLAQSVVASNFFVNNILSCITTGNYWDVVNSFKPLMHTWYLGIIVQCYVVYPLIFVVANKLCKKSFEKCSAVLLTIITAISLVLYLLPNFTAAQKFYYLPFRLFEISAGGMIAAMGLTNKKFKLKGIMWIFAVVAIVTMMPVFDNMLPSVRLLIMVAASVGALLYDDNAENFKISKTSVYKGFAKIGVASYSVYIWHQVIFAFYRYAVNENMGIVDYVVVILIAAVVSVLSYLFVEKKLQKIKRNKNIIKLIAASVAVCVLTTAFGLYLYINAGVVRDVPELDVYTNNIQRGMHGAYCDRVYDLDKDFEDDDRINVLVVGNSFARDWANILLESEMKDKLDITYIFSFENKEEYIKRAEQAEYIFIVAGYCTNGMPEYIEEKLSDSVKIWRIGTKSFGMCNGNIYNKRNSPDYFNSRAVVTEDVWASYTKEKELFKEHYIDFIFPVMDETGKVRVFTDDNKYISQDCRHLTQSGARFYARIFNIKGIFEEV